MDEKVKEIIERVQEKLENGWYSITANDKEWKLIIAIFSKKEKEIEETEAERHRLSKLLIEARIRIVELKEGIEKIVKSEYMNSLIIKEKLASLLKVK